MKREQRRRRFWLIDHADVEHAVTRTDLDAAVRAQNGRYRAICGAAISPAALTATPVCRCIWCVRHAS